LTTYLQSEVFETDLSIASFPGLPTIQFLITCNMQKRRGKAWYHLSRE